MEFVDALNIYLAPALICCVLFADLSSHVRLGQVRRVLLLGLLGCAALATVSQALIDLNIGADGTSAHILMQLSANALWLLQLAAYDLLVLALDYAISGDTRRVRRIGGLMLGIMMVNIMALAINVGSGFFFSISDENMYVPGGLFWVRLIFALTPVLIFAISLLTMWRRVGRYQLTLILLIGLPVLAAGFCDGMIEGGRLLWSCFSLSVLFCYLFMIRSDYRVDALTGLSSRRALVEWLGALQIQGKRPGTYGCVYIGLSRLKRVNDSFGRDEGDNALRDMAGVLRAATHPSDLLAHCGGDEFVMFVSNCRDVTPLTARIRDSIGVFNRGNRRPYALTFRMGSDLYAPTDARTPRQFLEHVRGRMQQDGQGR